MKLKEAEAVCRDVQAKVFMAVHNGRPVNTFEPAAAANTAVRADGMVYMNDISYESKYPNGFLDIWYPDENRNVQRPTVIHFHGGGFLFGDKISGDPLAEKSSGPQSFLEGIVKAGYNLVSANYAFAPEYHFPVPIVQVDEVMDFLMKNKEKYGLDMDHVILMGGSAGADMSAIYGGAVTNADYAKALGLTPVLKKEQLLALVINEAMLNVDDMSPNLLILLQNWLGVDEPAGSEAARLMNAALWMTPDYIPSFVVSSNVEEDFVKYAIELDEALEANGVRHELYYRDSSYDKLEHGFTDRYLENQYARECYDRMLAFMAESVY